MWLQVTTWSEGHATSWVSYPHHKSPPCQVWLPYALRKRGYYFFDLSRDLTWSHDKRVMRLHAWSPFNLSCYFAKFGGCRPCRRGNILFFICHVILCGHMVGGFCDTMGEFPLLQVTILPSLVLTGVVEEEIFCF